MDGKFLDNEEVQAKPLPKLKEPKITQEDKQNKRKSTVKKMAADSAGVDSSEMR